MPDFSAIGAVLGSLKTATEIAKFIRESDFSIERAEMKMKVADLIGALADVKLGLVSTVCMRLYCSRVAVVSKLEDPLLSDPICNFSLHASPPVASGFCGTMSPASLPSYLWPQLVQRRVRYSLAS